MKKVIIFISVENFSNGRGLAESYENSKFEDISQFKNTVYKHEDRSPKDDDFLFYEDFSELMDDMNDQVLNLEAWWMTYILIPE